MFEMSVCLSVCVSVCLCMRVLDRASQIPRDRGITKSFGKFIRRPASYTKLYCGYGFQKFEFLGEIFQ